MLPAGSLEAEEHVELIGIFNKPLLLHLLGCLYYLYLLGFKKSNVFCAACFISDFSEYCWEFHCCPIHSSQHFPIHNRALKNS
jgi:hypothetical protein